MLKLLGPGDLRKQVCLGPKTSHYAKFWAQNATKTSAGNIPESLSNLFLRDHCRLSQRLLNNADLFLIFLFSDSVKRHLRGRHLSALNLKFDFISDGGCTREEQIALSLKRHLFPHGGREPKAFWICFSRVHPPSEIKSNFKFKTLKRHLLKRHLTLSDVCSLSLPLTLSVV